MNPEAKSIFMRHPGRIYCFADTPEMCRVSVEGRGAGHPAAPQDGGRSRVPADRAGHAGRVRALRGRAADRERPGGHCHRGGRRRDPRGAGGPGRARGPAAGAAGDDAGGLRTHPGARLRRSRGRRRPTSAPVRSSRRHQGGRGRDRAAGPAGRGDGRRPARGGDRRHHSRESPVGPPGRRPLRRHHFGHQFRSRPRGRLPRARGSIRRIPRTAR